MNKETEQSKSKSNFTVISLPLSPTISFQELNLGLDKYILPSGFLYISVLPLPFS